MYRALHQPLDLIDGHVFEFFTELEDAAHSNADKIVVLILIVDLEFEIALMLLQLYIGTKRCEFIEEVFGCELWDHLGFAKDFPLARRASRRAPTAFVPIP